MRSISDSEVHLTNLAIMSLGRLAEEYQQYAEVSRKVQKLDKFTMVEADFENGKHAAEMLNIINSIAIFKYGVQFQWVMINPL